MMGFQETPARLFYDFCLDEHVPTDHLLRGIDRHLDLADLRQSLKPFYSQMGRPSVDPERMIRMLIVGYSMGIRSERRLCEEVHFNLAYRWFCRLGLDGRVPDHSTFSKNRHGRFRESEPNGASNRSFADRGANGSNQPFADLNDRPDERAVCARLRKLGGTEELGPVIEGSNFEHRVASRPHGPGHADLVYSAALRIVG